MIKQTLHFERNSGAAVSNAEEKFLEQYIKAFAIDFDVSKKGADDLVGNLIFELNDHNNTDGEKLLKILGYNTIWKLTVKLTDATSTYKFASCLVKLKVSKCGTMNDGKNQIFFIRTNVYYDG